PAASDEAVPSQDTETPPVDTADDKLEPVADEPAASDEAVSVEEEVPPKSDESVDAEPEDGDAKKIDEAPSKLET
ncbi:MAG: hypothetical protein JRK53_14610, partial [Deltaproteobacteria bacterium]|nr:hypothetical protein [Deltaproteobacteria bacterium]